MGDVNVTVLSIIVGYLILVTIVGLWVSSRVKSSSDYLIASSKMGFVLVAMTLVGSWEGTGTSIGVTQTAYTQGIYTGFYASFFAAGLVLTVFTLLKFIRFTISLTPAAMLGKLFGVQTQVMTSVLLIFQNLIVMAMQLVGGAGIMSGVLGIPYEWGLFAMLATTGLYSLAGGIVSTAWTNLIHAVVQNVAAIIAIPVVLSYVGGWDSLVSSLDPKYFSVEGMGFNNLAGWWWTLGLGVMVMSFQQVHQASSNKEAEKGFWLAAAMCAFYSIPFALMGVAAAAKFPGVSPLMALPKLTMAIDPLFAGIVLASVLAAALSTLGPGLAMMPLFVVNDLYKVAKPNATDREQLVVARISMVGIMVAAILIAVTVRTIVVANVFAFTFRSVMVLAIVFGMLLAGRRWITREGAFFGILSGAVGIFFSQFAVPDQPPIYVTVVFLVVGTAIASLLTRGRGNFSHSIWEILKGSAIHTPGQEPEGKPRIAH